MNGRRRGIMGGTFDPTHLGHLVMVADAREAFALDEILWIPSFVSPHKQGRAVAPPEHRLAMLELATSGQTYSRVSDLEIRRAGVSYSADTLRELRREAPSDEWFFIIGADSLLELHTWRDVDYLIGACRFITVMRPGHPSARLAPEDLHLPAAAAHRLIADVIQGHLIDVSSTEIRQRVRTGKSISHLVPEAVANYIARHQLYREEE